MKNFDYIHLLFIWFISLLLQIVNIFNPIFFDYLHHEDKVIEYLTALSFFASFIILVFAIKYTPNKVSFFFVSFMAFAFLFAFFEEISYGQRIFGVETPNYFKKNNMQNEINLHNMSSISNLIIILVYELMKLIVISITLLKLLNIEKIFTIPIFSIPVLLFFYTAFLFGTYNQIEIFIPFILLTLILIFRNKTSEIWLMLSFIVYFMVSSILLKEYVIVEINIKNSIYVHKEFLISQTAISISLFYFDYFKKTKFKNQHFTPISPKM